jgi:uncharacterized protein (DUF1684 family)
LGVRELINRLPSNHATDEGKPHLFFGIVLVIILILVYTFADTGVNDAYEREISQFRADKHEYFKSSADSPIKNKAQFSQLDYFPPDQHYRIMAALQPITDTARLQVRTTDGNKRC